jgi:hypothetical protein
MFTSHTLPYFRPYCSHCHPYACAGERCHQSAHPALRHDLLLLHEVWGMQVWPGMQVQPSAYSAHIRSACSAQMSMYYKP